MNKYRLTLKHDNGTFRITTSAKDEQTAIHLVMMAENCPRGAIVKIECELSIKDKQDALLSALKGMDKGMAIFGVEKEVVKPLIKRGLLHGDTFKFTGGALLTAKGTEYVKTL